MSDESESKGEGAACGCGGGSCGSGPGKWIWIVLVLAVVGVLMAKNAGKKDVSQGASATNGAPAVIESTGTRGIPEPATQVKAIPRLVDLGAGKCIPCKLMAPILSELKTNYVEKLDVQFIDVWEHPEESKNYGINLIPTQIFYDAQGKELFRHEGFYSKAEILAKWKEFGVDLADALPK